jgi:hypothetical protein
MEEQKAKGDDEATQISGNRKPFHACIRGTEK